jgi:hypothetical protein
MTRLLLLAAFALASPAFAAPTVEAGNTLTLKEDLVLTGDDSLEINGTADLRCTLVGNGHRIRSQGKWTGSVRLRHCDVRQLGTAPTFTADGKRLASAPAGLDLTLSGTGALTVEHCVLDECAAVHVSNDGESTTTFRGNTLHENTRARADKDVDKSVPCFLARGSSKARKLFQANRVYRSQARFTAPSWLVGGDSDADSNLCIGLRIGLFAEGEGTVVDDKALKKVEIEPVDPLKP